MGQSNLLNGTIKTNIQMTKQQLTRLLITIGIFITLFTVAGVMWYFGFVPQDRFEALSIAFPLLLSLMIHVLVFQIYVLLICFIGWVKDRD